MARPPTLSQLAAQLAALGKKVASLEQTDRRAAPPAVPATRGDPPPTGKAARRDAPTGKASRRAAAAAPSVDATTGDDLLALIERRNAGPRKRGTPSGAVVYGGSITAGSGEYLWAIERPAAGVLALDPARIAAVLAILGSAPRIRMLLAMIEAPRTAAELQRLIGSKSPGPVYHHLRDLLGLGVVAQIDRRYAVPPRHVVPILAAAAIALDLGARAS